MTDLACKSLADHLAERKANGLVDIKFYIHNGSAATTQKVCAEAEALFEAIDCGAIEAFQLTDKGIVVAQA